MGQSPPICEGCGVAEGIHPFFTKDGKVVLCCTPCAIRRINGAVRSVKGVA